MEIISPDSIQAFLQTAGYLGLFALIFIESGLLVGIFLPGDSVLFTAGFLASQGYFDIATLIIGTFIASILGDNFGFMLGRKFGKEIFNKEKSLFFNKKYIEQAQEFYELHGKKTIVLGRFVPVIRSVAPILSGISRMPYKTYMLFNIIGAAAWAGGLTMLGFFLGKTIPDIDYYILPIIGTIIIASVLPSIIKIVREKKLIAKFITGETALIKRYPKIRKTFGIVLIVYGLLALATPFTPGSWLIFIGLELIGIRLVWKEKIQKILKNAKEQWLQKK